MTVVPTNSISGPYVGDGINDTFPITFNYDLEAEVVVYQLSTSGVETVLANPANYTIVGSDVVTVAPPAAGVKITIRRETDMTQAAELTAQGPGFSPATHEDAWDKMTRGVQEAFGDRDLTPRANASYKAWTPRQPMLLIGEATVAGTELEVTDIELFKFDSFRLEMLNLQPSISATKAVLELSRNNGSTYLSTGYVWRNRRDGSVSSNYSISNSDSEWELTVETIQALGGLQLGLSMALEMHVGQLAASEKGAIQLYGHGAFNESAGMARVSFGGYYALDAASNTPIALRVRTPGQNINGTFRVWGRPR